MSDIIFIVEEYGIASYADNNTSYFGSKSTKNAMLNLAKLPKKYVSVVSF